MNKKLFVLFVGTILLSACATKQRVKEYGDVKYYEGRMDVIVELMNEQTLDIEKLKAASGRLQKLQKQQIKKAYEKYEE